MESADSIDEEKKLMNDAKYRNYMTNIDKALRNFEFSSEWADLISALGKLSKAISSNTQYQVIPRRIKISKRLAQCMHPALPSGVHLKALETYAVIFAKTGPERLATELFIYSSGLFPLLGYAAMNVRPALLQVYETYFVPLGERLRPALSGFLSGVLPGYECGLDHFERTNALLTQVCAAVNPTHFYTVLWECVATNASIRLPAISYLLEHFNKRLGMQEQFFIMGHNRDTMMSGLCACLNDSLILVQRNSLEFLLLGFPMHTTYLCEADLIKLVTNGLNSILRRDMSLNRRLYAWLLGTEVSKNSPVGAYDTISLDSTIHEAPTETYFEKHSKHIVIQALIRTLKFSLECTPVDLKPYRIMVSLLDKADIGSVVLDFVLCDIIRTMSLSSHGNAEVVKSANLLFATFDPAYIWSFMTTMYGRSCKTQRVNSVKNSTKSVVDANGKYQCVVGSGDPCLVEICYLTEFLLETISLEMYNETTRIYLPKVFLAITQMLTVHLEQISCDEITASLRLCMKIVSRVQPMITSPIKLLPRTMQGYSSSEERTGNATLNQGMSVGNPLEKSKSDSKLNHSVLNINASALAAAQAELTGDPIRRSNSNQNMERKSPKKKKAKSYSKLSELDKEICPDTGMLIDPQKSSSDLDSPLSIKKLKYKTRPYIRIRSSPKKARPKDIPLRNMGQSPEPHSLDNVLLKTHDGTDGQPKSAPPERNETHTDMDEFVFDNDKLQASPEEFSILEKCIRQYEVFFEAYMSKKVLQISISSQQKKHKLQEEQELNVEDIFKNENIFEDQNVERLADIEKLFGTLRIQVISRTKELQHLLHRTLDDNELFISESNVNITSPNKQEEQINKNIQRIIDLRVSNVLKNAIKLASNLLVEMSTFPNCNKHIMLDSVVEELPSWLKVLCLMACYTQGDKELQLAAITTLFDLISLLKSQIEHTTSPGVTFVVMLPLLKFGHVTYMEQRTRVFHLVSSVLWNYLGAQGVDATQITSLLYQLHNCLESGLVETVIGNRIHATPHVPPLPSQDPQQVALRNYSEQKFADLQLICVQPFADKVAIELRESEAKSLKKFEILWHLGRDKKPAKGFEKTLLKVLDTLGLPYYVSMRISVTKWLQSALLRGDLGRLMKPLYKILLAANTKRISIMHLHLLQQEGVEGPSTVVVVGSNIEGHDEHAGINSDKAAGLERDVYAISSEYGNIKYHLDANSGKKRSPIRTFQKKIFGVTLSSKNKTANFVSDKATAAAQSVLTPTEIEESGLVNNIGLIINPFNISPDFDDDPETDNVEMSAPNSQTLVEQAVEQQSDNCEKVNTLQTEHGDEREEELIEDEEEDEVDDEEDEEQEVDDDDDDLIPDCEQDFTDESDSSIFDSESEQRETSIEKDYEDMLVQATNLHVHGLKRFAGDCDLVSEKLSQHERTKNRKTYRLTREKTPLDLSLTSNDTTTTTTSVTTNAEEAPSLTNNSNIESHLMDDDAAHPADEYFNQQNTTDDKKQQQLQQRQKQHHHNKSANNNEIESENADDYLPEKTTVTTTKITSSETTSTTTTTTTVVNKKKKNRRLRTSLAAAAISAGKEKTKKFMSAAEKKRLSCISKTSTDSNNSFREPYRKTKSTKTKQPDSGAEEVDEVELQINDENSTINVEAKRRNLSLETNSKINDNTKNSEDWEQTLERSKRNLNILRENAANDAQSKRSSTKSGTSSDSNTQRQKVGAELQQQHRLHFYHQHMLIYLNIYDTKQTLYAFQTLRNIMCCDTRTFLCLCITTSLSSSSLKQQLIRHRKSISGKLYAGNISNSEFSQSYRGCMHLEVLVTLCLHYARGFLPRLTLEGSTQMPVLDDVQGNCRVQLQSIELLTLMCNELIDIVKGMGRGLALYIADLMSRCKLQKVILHCLNSSICAYGHQYGQGTLPEQILQFNDAQDDKLHAESFQLQLLRLLMAVIKLEHEVQLLKLGEGNTSNPASANAGVGNKTDFDNYGNISPTRLTNINQEAASINVKYLPNCPISQQPMFLAAILSALQDDRLRHLHRNWTDLVTSSLNCFSHGSLTNIVISVVHQLCNNIERICQVPLKELPTDYVISQLEAITILCHYCLLDNTQQTTLSHLFNQAYPQTSVVTQNSNTGQLLNSIVHSFLSSAAASTPNQSDSQSPKHPQLLAARNAVLSHLSRIVTSVAVVWDSELGQQRQVKQQLMEFLSPVSLHHGANFLAAVAVTWQQRGEQQRRATKTLSINTLSVAEQYQRHCIPQASSEQLNLVNLVSSIRVMPMDCFVQTLHQVVKTPPPIHRPPAHLAMEVSALELFYFYMKSAPVPQLGDCWSSLLALLRDGLSLSPPAQFSLLMLLNEFVQRCPQMPFQDKKDIRDLHDITSRLVDSLSNVAGSCLEQTTWLRRNLAVKEDLSPVTTDGNTKDSNFMGGQQQYSVQAQSVLAATLANLLDVAYSSQEKDKVVTIITALLYNITPYLKNHTARNVPSFYACSSLLASISSYQYTRKAWRKDMLDLLLDPAFFQIDICCLPFWKQIMDNLMTYDTTTFRELMSRVSLTQTGSLNIFTSREQEYEQRAMLLKRLAFVIFCSEFDQYNKYMPEIQEQLVNSLRLLSVPSVQASVFLCFRVLLLRMSPDHVTSLWPIIIAEMVQVFLSIEQDLKSELEDRRSISSSSSGSRMLSGVDVSWSSNGLSAQNQISHWRAVQLEASKLLELGCVLPATKLPHFQMYRWAFVGTEFDVHEEVVLPSSTSTLLNGSIDEDIINTASLPTSIYVPHIPRIARLMDMKYTMNSAHNNSAKSDQHLVLNFQHIQSLNDLYGFFSTLSVTCPNPLNYADNDREIKSCLEEIESVLAKDFLERMPQSSNNNAR